MKNRTRAVWILLWTVLMIFTIHIFDLLPAHAENVKSRTVRVAYPPQEGLTDFDEHGSYSGYTYEYLEEIAQYTGWDYEFVQVNGDADESLQTLMEMLENGDIDLMGAMLYSDKTNRLFDYSSHSYGTVETVLQVPYDKVQDFVINSQVEQTMNIAVPSTGTRIIQEFEDYCDMNLITPNYIFCADDKDQLEAVRNGDADAMLNSSMNYVEGVRTIARFASKPFYFVTTKGENPDLLAELNAAMASVELADPYFTTALYEKYFSAPNNQLVLTDAEKTYIKNADELNVGFLSGQPPLQYKDEDGHAKGISADLFSYISDKTGLKFNYIVKDTPDELYAMAQDGTIDILANIDYDYSFAREHHMSMTQPYITSQYILMMRESSSEESIKGQRLALADSMAFNLESMGQVIRFRTVKECINAISDKKADYTYVDAYTAQYFLNQPKYKSLKLVPKTNEERRMCSGIVKPIDRTLLSILNKTIATIPENDMQSIINLNTIQRHSFSLSYIIQANPLETVLMIAAAFILVIIILSVILHQRAAVSKRNALELSKHLRVYALLNEYFLEYNHRTKLLIVSIPQENEDALSRLTEYDFSKPSEDEAVNESRAVLMNLFESQKSGVREIYLRCSDNKYHWLKLALETVYDNDTPVYTLGKVNIIDAERQEKDALLEKAQLDSLTHIYNAGTVKAMIHEYLTQLPSPTGALILLDIDHFKDINDTYGHRKGDEALIRFSELLRGSFRSGDIIGRPGGDEFVIFMKSVKDEALLSQKCEALLTGVRQISIGGTHLSVSIGAALTREGISYATLYESADNALYEAKRKGRNQYCIRHA